MKSLFAIMHERLVNDPALILAWSTLVQYYYVYTCVDFPKVPHHLLVMFPAVHSLLSETEAVTSFLSSL